MVAHRGCAWFLLGGVRGFCWGGMRGFCWGACVVFARGGMHRIRRDMVNERAVRILLECILVWPNFTKNCMKMKTIGQRGGVCPKCCYVGPPVMSSDRVSLFFPGIAGPLSLEISRDSSPETKPKTKKKATPSGKKKHKEPATGKDTSEPLCRVVPAEALEKGDLLLRSCGKVMFSQACVCPVGEGG